MPGVIIADNADPEQTSLSFGNFVIIGAVGCGITVQRIVSGGTFPQVKSGLQLARLEII